MHAQLAPEDDALKVFAEAYGEAFCLAHGDTLGSILDAFLGALAGAGFTGLSSDAWRPPLPTPGDGEKEGGRSGGSKRSPVRGGTPGEEAGAQCDLGGGDDDDGLLPMFAPLPVPTLGPLPPVPVLQPQSSRHTTVKMGGAARLQAFADEGGMAAFAAAQEEEETQDGAEDEGNVSLEKLSVESPPPP